MKDQYTAKIKSEMGRRLFAAALADTTINTRKAAEELVKSTKGRKKMSIKAAADLVQELHKHINTRRNTRNQRRKIAHGVPTANGTRMNHRTDLRGRRSGREILGAKLKSALRSAGYRLDCSGDYSLSVAIGKPSASGYSEKGEQYSKNCTYRKTDVYHSVTVAPGFSRLIKSDMIIVDGLLNVSCEQIDANTYRATWIRQGRGFEISAVSGYIVKHPKYGTAHAKTLGAAKGILTQRKRAEQVSHALKKIKTELENFRSNGVADVTVRLCDSFRAGNCAEGTYQWLEKHFPDRNPKTDTATVRELISIDDQHRYVVAACLQAVRRQSHAIKM